MYKTPKIFIFLLFFFITFTSVSAPTTVKTIDSEVLISQAILVDINAYRKKYKLNPLTMDSRISAIAKTHSLNMAKKQISFGHTHFLQRVTMIRKQIKDAGAAAENVAFNYKDAHDVVKNWILSRGHRNNILGNYNHTGVGLARDSRGRIYFTQIFINTGSTQYVAKATSLPHFLLPLFNKS